MDPHNLDPCRYSDLCSVPQFPGPLSICTRLHLQSVGHKTMLALLPPPLPPSSHTVFSATTVAPLALSRTRPVQTLILGAASELAAEELRPAVDSALRCVWWVWGAGVAGAESAWWESCARRGLGAHVRAWE